LEENAFLDPEWRLAYHVLKSNGFSPPWIEARQEIETEIEKARASLRRSWQWRQGASQQNLAPGFVEAEWSRAVQLFEVKIEELNRQIFSYNLEAPLDRFYLARLDREAEIESACRSEQQS